MRETIITTHILNGEVELHLDQGDGEVVALKATCADWRQLINMLTHQMDVSERYTHPLTHRIVMGTA